jgi:carboxylesterase type B
MDTLPKLFLDGHVIVADDAYPNAVPLLIGTNRDEARLFLVGKRDLVAKPELYLPTARHLSQQWKLGGADSIARAITAQPKSPPVFVYEFLWGHNAGGEPVVDPKAAYLLGASHSLDIDFFLNQSAPWRWMLCSKANSGHPGHADGHGRYRRSAVARTSPHNPANPQLAQPRPLRAVQRPRLDAALLRCCT